MDESAAGDQLVGFDGVVGFGVADHVEDVETGGETIYLGIVRGPKTGIAFHGALVESVAASGNGDAAEWASPDGISWSRVSHNEVVFGGEGSQGMGSVTAAGPGLVAVGQDGPFDDADATVRATEC